MTNTLEYGQWGTYNGQRYMIVNWTLDHIALFIDGKAVLVHADKVTEITDYMDVTK